MTKKNIFKNILMLSGAGTILGVFVIFGMTLAIYAGSLTPSANNGLSNGSPIASMLSLLDMTQTTSGTFDRTTDSLEAISNKIDGIAVNGPYFMVLILK